MFVVLWDQPTVLYLCLHPWKDRSTEISVGLQGATYPGLYNTNVQCHNVGLCNINVHVNVHVYIGMYLFPTATHDRHTKRCINKMCETVQHE